MTGRTKLRSIAETVTHRLVLKRRLPAPFEDVQLYVSSESGLRYLKRKLTNVDPDLLRAATRLVQSGDVVWDVGANIGLFSFAAAARAGHTGTVLAIEADTWNVGLLRRSGALSGAGAGVQVLPAAVSDTVGISSFNIAVRSRSTNHLATVAGSTQTGGVRETQLVPSVTLDYLLGHFPGPDVLKIDIEGAESLALQGANEVLSLRPVLICEVAQENATAVRDLLKPHGYRFFDGEQDVYTHALDIPPYMTIALPES